MKRRPLWPIARAAGWILFYAACSAGALYFADYAVVRQGLPGLHRLYALSQLPERQLGQRFITPGRIHATLYPTAARQSPSGRSCAIWYGWIEHTRRSGKNTYTDTVCARGEDEALTLRQGDRTASLQLFHHDEQIALVKDNFLETLPLDRVALDLGEIAATAQIPLPMRQLCAEKIPRTGELSYREACAPVGIAVTVVGCAEDGIVHSCGSPPGALSVRRLEPVLRAYANASLGYLRGAAACVGIALTLLASALFKLRAVTARGS